MQDIQVHIAIIGAGTAGISAYTAARKQTNSLILLEGGHHGTTCARVGCMPSKLLIAAAEAAHQMELAPNLGVTAKAGIEIDGEQVMHRLKSERDRFVSFAVADVDNLPAEHRLDEFAHFTGPNTLETSSGKKITARNIIIATGSSTFIPENFKAAEDRLITNDDVFSWNDLPKSIAVFGPGVIGLELSQALSRLGVRVSLFGRGGALGPIQDEKVREVALANFKQEFNLCTKAEVSSIKRVEAGVEVIYTDPEGATHTEVYDYLLAATGRRPNLDKLNLAATGLKLDERGQPEFNPETSQAINADGSQSHIFIAGDVAAFRPLLHEANDEGFNAGTNAANWPEVKPRSRRTPLAVVFTEPQIGFAGASLPQLEAEYGADKIAIGEVDFTRQGRARVMQQNQGLIRFYAHKDNGKLLGAEIFTPRAEHFAHLLAWSIQQGLSLAELLEMPFYHPVMEEGLRSGLRNTLNQIKKPTTKK